MVVRNPRLCFRQNIFLVVLEHSRKPALAHFCTAPNPLKRLKLDRMAFPSPTPLFSLHSTFLASPWSGTFCSPQMNGLRGNTKRKCLIVSLKLPWTAGMRWVWEADEYVPILDIYGTRKGINTVISSFFHQLVFRKMLQILVGCVC